MVFSAQSQVSTIKCMLEYKKYTAYNPYLNFGVLVYCLDKTCATHAMYIISFTLSKLRSFCVVFR